MARIFYRVDTGDIYGVHPDGNIRVPNDVDFIDVPEAPHEIPWPALPDGRLGSEHTSRVAGRALVLRDDLPPLAPLTAEELFDMLKAEGIDLTARRPRPRTSRA